MDLPAVFLERMKGELKDEYGDFLQSLQMDEIKALRINPLKSDGALLEDKADKWNISRVEWEENGYYYECKDDSVLPPGKHPLHEAGMYYIQEASAMYPVNVLDPKKGERVLDLCAAPGGKSSQIAAHMDNGGLLVSNEIISSRAAVLSSNIERMGIRNTVVTNMEPEKLAAFFPAFFDRILVDAPCSGEGMFRRGPAAAENWSPENVAMCAQRQAGILDEAAKMLKPGGRRVYSTCTFASAEDEDNIKAFLERYGDYELISSQKLYPHKIKGEGHFVSLLQRKGELSASKSLKIAGKGKIPEEVTVFLKTFLKEGALKAFPEERMFIFGDSVYLAPEGMMKLKGLKVLRPGLQLGILKKNRFEPSHALAMTLRAEDVNNVYNLDAESPEALAYLKGQSLSPDTALPKDGWCLVTFNGISAGLGKRTGNIIKNHYPKGLRINL